MMKKAFTLIEILIVVAIIGLLAAIGVPSFIRSQQHAKDNIKKINISSVNAAKEQWAIINNQATGTAVTWEDIREYVGGSITNLGALDIDGDSIRINEIGTSASY
jgi:prepilin-type N-terminal cleavage/methylation domain-containing protein